jgi:hypothetical protein
MKKNLLFYFNNVSITFFRVWGTIIAFITVILKGILIYTFDTLFSIVILFISLCAVFDASLYERLILKNIIAS